MRTETINIYKFSELSQESKEVAIKHYIDNYYKYGYPWQYETYGSLAKFCKIFNIKLSGCEVSINSSVDCSFSNIDENILGLCGIRLRTYLVNNFPKIIYEPKHYRELVKVGEKYEYQRKSKILKDIANCPLTGYSADHWLIDPLLDFIQKPDPKKSFEELLNSCIYSWEVAASEECEWLESEEYIQEESEANEYEFNEDGTRY